MKHALRAIPVLLILAATSASAQFYKLKGGSLSVGGTGQFSTILTSSPNTVSTSNPAPTTALNQQQYTTDSAGFITSLQFHPVSWAGVALNYGFTHNSEIFGFNYANQVPTQTARVSTDIHEFTGGYLFHPRHIPFQPYVEVGGGALDFAPRNASSQFRGAGLLETGFDFPTHNKHIGFRVSGRSLYYRSPNFYTPQISTRSWRVTEEPSVSTYYRF